MVPEALTDRTNRILTPRSATPQEMLGALQKDLALYKEAMDQSGYQRQ